MPNVDPKVNCLATWIYLDSPEESSEYPQVGKGSHLPEFQKVYWRCVAVFYALSKRTNPEMRQVLFTNQRPENLPDIDGFDLQAFLASNGVEVITIPLTHQTPKGYYGKWRNQFYIFDILQFIENQYSSEKETWMILDSDCLVTEALDSVFEQARTQELMVLPMRFDHAYNINGVTRVDMQRIFGEYDGTPVAEVPEYCGGEVFLGNISGIKKINAQLPGLWDYMQHRFQQGLPKLNEEAHFLSYFYYKIGQFGLLEGVIKRIWTSPKYSNMTPADYKLAIWHLPAEKSGGIAILFEYLKKNKLFEQMEKQGVKPFAGACVGIPRRRKYLNLKHFLKYTQVYRWLAR